MSQRNGCGFVWEMKGVSGQGLLLDDSFFSFWAPDFQGCVQGGIMRRFDVCVYTRGLQCNRTFDDDGYIKYKV